MTPLVRTNQLVVGYGGRALLPPVDLSIGSGQLWAVIGKNGSGKTTLLRTLLGFLAPVSGQVERKEGLRVAYLPQRSGIDAAYPLSASDVVALGMERGKSFLSRRRPGESARVEAALAEMGIAELRNAPFRDLSEGQKQRVLFARLVAAKCEIAFLDEPTSAMDVDAERAAFQLLRSIVDRDGTTIVVVSHYLGLVRDFSDHAVLLDRVCGRIVAGLGTDIHGEIDAASQEHV
jgi:zinc transport system ATP-binding protein